MSDYRVIVTGSRDFRSPLTVYERLADVRAIAHETREYDRFIVVHGANPAGADKHAACWCLFPDVFADMPVIAEPHPVKDWSAPCLPECRPGHRRRRRDGSTYCPAMGNYRNQEMVDAGAHLTLAFFWEGAANRGTSDCVARAQSAAIPVWPFRAG